MAEKVERRLAAILSADVVGYSRLMATDEAGTLARLKAHRRDLIDPKISEHNGRLVKLMGDGALVEFASVVGAVECAVSIQQDMATRNETEPENQRIEFRIGINLGEIIVDGDDIYGDGVNIAARMEQLAEPGGVFISEEAYRQARGRAEAEFEDLGEKQVKNIEQPVRVYAVTPKRTELGQVDAESEALPQPSKPSIAVLPFENMSGDPEQEYFSDGIAEDIITGLSRFRDLFVIARNSSFTYKGRAVDIKQVGRELGVRYVLEGGVRKAGNRVRITAQLIEAATGNHLWAEKYDGDLSDIFDLQDSITDTVVGAIQPTVFLAEIERVRRKRPDNLDAYDMTMRGWAHEFEMDEQSLPKARDCFQKAIALDDRLAQAHTGLAWTYFWEAILGWRDDMQQGLADATLAAQRAVAIDETDAEAHASLCWPLVFSGRIDDALAGSERVVELSPNNARARCFQGLVFCQTGRATEGVEEAKMALRLSPRDSFRYLYLHCLAECQYSARFYTAAAESAAKVIALKPNYLYGYWHLAGSCAQLGQIERAQTALAEVLRLNPNFDRAFVEAVAPYEPADLEHLIEGLQKAGWEG